MKRNKPKNRKDQARNADIGTPLYGYTAFSGDLRLSRPIADLTGERKSPAKKKGSRLVASISIALIVAIVVALPLIFLWNYLKDEPGKPSYEPPIYTPPSSGQTEQPTTTPSTPSTPSAPPATSHYWVPTELTFDSQEFLDRYHASHGTMSLGFGLYANGGMSYKKEITTLEWLTRCSYIMEKCFRYRNCDIEFEGGNIIRMLTFFLLDELEPMRRQMAADEVAMEKECLLVVENAGARFGKICYVYKPTINYNSKIPLQAKVRDEDVPSLLGGYSIGQWSRHASARDDTYDAVWTKYMPRAAVRALYDEYADQIAKGLMLYLYGYTTWQYRPGLGGYYSQAYYNAVNEGLDDTAMQIKKNELADYIAKRLPRFPEKEQEINLDRNFSVGVVPYLLYRSVIDMMPNIVSDFLGMKYEDFLSDAAFVRAPYDAGLLRARYNEHGKNTVIGIPRRIERSNLNDLLSSLTFEKKDIDLTLCAEISFYDSVFPPEELDFLWFPIPVLAAGSDGQGNYYLQSGDYCAKLTKKQFEEFFLLCTEGEIDNYPYATERHELANSK